MKELVLLMLVTFLFVICVTRADSASNTDDNENERNGIADLLLRLKKSEEKLSNRPQEVVRSQHGRSLDRDPDGENAHTESHHKHRHHHNKHRPTREESDKTRAICHARILKRCADVVDAKISAHDNLTKKIRCDIRQTFLRCVMNGVRRYVSGPACDKLAIYPESFEQIDKMKEAIASVMYQLGGCLPGV